jgi:hypothetical protein
MLSSRFGRSTRSCRSRRTSTSCRPSARLRHRIRQFGEAALRALSEDEGSAADRLGEAARAFAQLAAIDPREAPHRDEAEELKRRVADLAAAARDGAGAIEADPERLTALETRVGEIARLKRKYGGSVAEVLRRADALRAEAADLSHVEEALGRRQREEASAAKDYAAAAAALSAKRNEAAPRFASAVEKELRGLALEKARFRVALDPLDDVRLASPSTPAAASRAPRARVRDPLLRAQSGRAGEAARADRVGRRAVPRPARDPNGLRRPGPEGADADLRRGRRRHRRPGRGGRRQEAA